MTAVPHTLLTRQATDRGGEERVTGFVLIALIVLLAPLSYLYGVDSRRLRDRGIFNGPAR
jgi:hypothetical protein